MSSTMPSKNNGGHIITLSVVIPRRNKTTVTGISLGTTPPKLLDIPSGACTMEYT